MTAMHNILVLYPEHLNLNGDVANAGVLARRMNWYGIDAAIDFYYPGDVLPGHQPDFVLLGHGSVAAWKSIDDDFKRVFPVLQAWVAAGVFGLAVNSGQELLHKAPTKIFAQTLTEGERVSEFVVSEVAWLGDGARLVLAGGIARFVHTGEVVLQGGACALGQQHRPLQRGQHHTHGRTDGL